MPSSTVEVHQGAVHLDLSSDQLRKLGWEDDQRIEVSQHGNSVTLRPRTTGDKAVIRSDVVGFNTGIELPKQVNGHFEVLAFRKHDRRSLGKLVFTEDGELIPELSTPDSKLCARCDAP